MMHLLIAVFNETFPLWPLQLQSKQLQPSPIPFHYVLSSIIYTTVSCELQLLPLQGRHSTVN